MVKLSGMFIRFFPAICPSGWRLYARHVYYRQMKRISPEAPVSVLHAQKEESRPGGAGNVALNCISLGANVIVSVV